MARNLTQESRTLPAGAAAPATWRRLEFPLLGRGPDHLRQARAAWRPRSPTSTTTCTSTTAWATVRRSSATPIRAWMRRRAQGMEVGGVFALVTERELRSPSASPDMVPARRAGALLQLRHRGGHGGAAAGARLLPARTTTSFSRAATTACSTPRCGTRRWRNGTRSASRTVVSPTARACRSADADFRALRAGERRQPARGRLQAHGRLDRLPC